MNKMLCAKQQLNAGFSLTEVMIAVLIFAFSLVTLAKFAGNLFSMNSYAQQRTQALNYAQQKLADLQSFAKINTTTGYRAYQDIANGNDTVAGTNATYTRSWTVTTNTTVGYKTVVITVTWTAQDGSNKTLSLNSIIGENDPSDSAQAIMALPSGTITP